MLAQRSHHQQYTVILATDTARVELPLVEPYDNHNKRVTFYGKVRNLMYIYWDRFAGDHDPLTRLANSDIWYRSYIVPNDTLMQYKLAPDVPVIENATVAAAAPYYFNDGTGRSF